MSSYQHIVSGTDGTGTGWRGLGAGGGVRRRFTVGAEIVPGGGVHFRVWAPDRRQVQVVVDGQKGQVALRPDGDGYWAGLVQQAGAGTRYQFCLDDDDRLYPDPASRFQPDGPHGKSQVVDAARFLWTDDTWRGVTARGQILYELHVGTFTPQGTWQAAAARLAHLAALGVTVIEVMPVAEWTGRFGWGYDGVNPFAPFHHYGTPDDLRAFVDEAHRLGLGVILDVVYNHLGADGNYLGAFAPGYVSEHGTEWGAGINFDGDSAKAVRALFSENAAYWIADFHLDGLRLDATQSIRDRAEGAAHIIAEIVRAARLAAGGREILVIGENEPQDTRLLRAQSHGGQGLDGLWNDDFHHSALVALTGHREAYYTDYQGSAQELLSAAKYGFLYQGQRYAWQKRRRGRPSRGLPSAAFVCFLENHDQVANTACGQRLHQRTAPGALRAMTGLLLLGPWTPLLLQGQEWGSSPPFPYFADSTGPLARTVRAGRLQFLSQFPSYASAAVQAGVPDPAAPATFAGAHLDWDELASARAQAWLALHQDLLALRSRDPAIAAQGAAPVTVDGAVLTPECLALRFFMPDQDDRLLVVNLGRERPLVPAPEPLLAPPDGRRWRVVWCSEDPKYGGSGIPHIESDDDGWHLIGQSATLLAAQTNPEDSDDHP